MTSTAAMAAVVLAGGTGLRLGGADKARLEHAGRTLLDRAVAACRDAEEVVVVGPAARTPRPVTFVVEEPPRGGPAAGLLAGRDALTGTPSLLAVVAVDMAGVGPATLRRLREAAAGRDGAFLREPGPGGRRQLVGVVALARLDAVRPAPGDQHGLPLHRLLATLDLAEVEASSEEAFDVDTWADLRRLGGIEP